MLLRRLAILAIAATWACSGSGGATEDFTGDMELCSTVSMVELDEVSPLGFTAQSVLDYSVGRFEVPIRWVARCRDENWVCWEQCGEVGTNTPQPLVSGTETTVSIEIAATGARARVIHPSASEPVCAEDMTIPVSVRMSTADGAVMGQFDAGLSTESGSSSSVGRLVPLNEVQGALAGDSAFPPTAMFHTALGFYGNKFWFEIYVYPDAEMGTPLLEELLPPYDTCLAEIPRDSVAR